MVLLILGVVALTMALVDIVVTTITMQGAGPLSGRIMGWTWRGLLAIHRRNPSHRMMTAGGIGIIAFTVVFWVLLLWTGWSLVFLSSDGAIVRDGTGDPADFWTHVYYAGYTLFTLGLGDYRPTGAVWQVLTAVCVANGLLALTLSVSYMVPVVSAAVEKRQLAVLIACLGGSPEQILRRNWHTEGFASLGQLLMQLSPLIVKQSQQHLAYPVLHYVHSGHHDTALPLRLAALDETLTVLEHGVKPEARPDPGLLMQIRSAITVFLNTFEAARLEPEPEAPPAFPLESVGELPVAPGASYDGALNGLQQRRRLMLALVRNDGWSWDEISGTSWERK